MNNNMIGLFNFCCINDELQFKNSPHAFFVSHKPITRFYNMLFSLIKMFFINKKGDKL